MTGRLKGGSRRSGRWTNGNLSSRRAIGETPILIFAAIVTVGDAALFPRRVVLGEANATRGADIRPPTIVGSIRPWLLLVLRAVRRRRGVVVIFVGRSPVVIVPAIAAIGPLLIPRRQEVVVLPAIDLHRPSAANGLLVVLTVVVIHGRRPPLAIGCVPIAMHLRRIVRDHHRAAKMKVDGNLC